MRIEMAMAAGYVVDVCSKSSLWTRANQIGERTRGLLQHATLYRLIGLSMRANFFNSANPLHCSTFLVVFNFNRILFPEAFYARITTFENKTFVGVGDPRPA